MKNKLFLICPASQTEALIKEQYGQEVFFLTAPGAAFNFQDINYMEALGASSKERLFKRSLLWTIPPALS